MSKLKEKGFLPDVMTLMKRDVLVEGLNYVDKPGKNFLLENIKRLRVMQKENQRKLAALNPPTHFRKDPVMVGRNYPKNNNSEPNLSCQYDKTSMKSRLSTPVTAMASPIPMKNQKMQTVSEKVIKKQQSKLSQLENVPAPKVNTKKSPKKKQLAKTMQRAASVPSLHVDSDVNNSSLKCNERLSPGDMKQLVIEKLLMVGPDSGEGEKKDFVTYNTLRTYQEKAKPEPKPDPIKPPPSYRVGEIPKYLKKDPLEGLNGENGDQASGECQGYVLLSEAERKDHMEQFKIVYSDLVCKLRNIPLSSDSYKNRQKKMHLEKELEKMENLMKLFSRRRLYLKVM